MAAYGKGGEKPQKLELLIIAESELNGGADLAMEDFLRLFFVPCPIRVLVFQGRIRDIDKKIVTMLETHAAHVKGQSIGWLFLGVPLYADWVEHKREGVKVNWQAYMLPARESSKQLTAIADKDWG
jgi:hypothetical protein